MPHILICKFSGTSTFKTKIEYSDIRPYSQNYYEYGSVWYRLIQMNCVEIQMPQTMLLLETQFSKM